MHRCGSITCKKSTVQDVHNGENECYFVTILCSHFINNSRAVCKKSTLKHIFPIKKIFYVKLSSNIWVLKC